MWIQLVIMIVSLIIQLVTRPHPQKPPAATLNDVNIPTIAQGTPICVVFGDVRLNNWMVLWYGALRNSPIKSGGKK